MGSGQSTNDLEQELKTVNEEIQRLKSYELKSQNNLQNALKRSRENLQAQKCRLDKKFDEQYFQQLLEEYGRQEFEKYVEKHLELERSHRREVKKLYEERKLEKSLIFKDIKKAKARRVEVWKRMIRVEWKRMEFVKEFNEMSSQIDIDQ